ncbi:MAG: MlaD family protein [Solirubrobacterales bacterium]
MRRRMLGAAVILAGILIVAFVALRPDPFADHSSVWVEFDSVQGLGSIDRDVRVAGVNVGEIGKVERDGDDARVQLLLDKDEVSVHSDARADLRPHTLFEGTAFVDLSPGSPGAPLLADGGQIPRSHSTVYVSLDQALRILRQPTREGFRGLLRSASKTLRGKAISGLQQTLGGAPPLTADLAPAARALTGPDGIELAGTVRGLSDTVDDLAANERQLVPLAGRADRTLAALETGAGAPLDRSLQQLPGALEQLRRTGPSLGRTIRALGTLARNARPALPELKRALKDLAPLLDRANPVLAEARPLIAELRIVLARLTQAAPALRSVITQLGPGVHTLNSSLLPFLTSDSRLGVPTYLQLLSAFTSGTGALAAYQTAAQNPLGEGHLIRLGAYLDPAGFSKTGIPSCTAVAALDPNVATELQALGLCQP